MRVGHTGHQDRDQQGTREREGEGLRGARDWVAMEGGRREEGVDDACYDNTLNGICSNAEQMQRAVCVCVCVCVC